MLRTMQDDSLPQTRKSIFTFTFFSVAIYSFKPTIALDEVVFLEDLSRTTIEPEHFGLASILAIFYLLWRLVHFIPIYQYHANQPFEAIFEKLEKNRDRLEDSLEKKLSSLKAIDRHEIDKRIEEFDSRRSEMVHRLDELKTIVNSASEEIKKDTIVISEHLRDLKAEVRAFPGDSTEGIREISRGELVSRYQKLLTPPSSMRNPFQIINSVLDENRTDLSDIGLKPISSHPKELESSIQKFLDSDHAEISNIRDNTRDARKSSNAEANTFTIWVPTILASIGLSFGGCLALQVEGYLVPIASSFLTFIPTCGFVKFYRPGQS